MDLLLIFHVAVSVIALLWGGLFSLQILQNELTEARTRIFLLLTLLTSISGVVLPADKLLPSHLFVALTLLLLAVALYARYSAGLQGRWRPIFLISSLLTFYLNAFVAVVQAFMKIPVLQPLAPTQTELPFIIAQLLLLLAFGWLIFRSCRSGPTQS